MNSNASWCKTYRSLSFKIPVQVRYSLNFKLELLVLVRLFKNGDGKTHVVVELIKNEKAKSAIWNHFKLKKENKKLLSSIAVFIIAYFIIYNTVKYSGGTTNFVRHMRRHHDIGDVSSKCIRRLNYFSK